MISARYQTKHDGPWIEMKFVSLPRVNEYLMINDNRFRVCQVQYRLQHTVESTHFAPYLILQQEH